MKSIELLQSLQDEQKLWPEQESRIDLSSLRSVGEAAGVDSNFNLIDDTPEQAADYSRLANLTGLPVHTVRKEPNRVRKIVERPDVFNLAKNWPNTAKYFEKLDSAAISRRDTDVLTKIEDWVNINRESWARNKEAFKDLGTSFRVGKEMVEGGKIGMAASEAALIGEPSEELETRLREFNAKATDSVETSNVASFSVHSAAQMLPIVMQSIWEGHQQGTYGLAAGAVMGSAVPGVGSLAGGSTGYAVASRAGAAKAMFEIEGGNAYREFRQLRSVPTEAIARVEGPGADISVPEGELLDPQIAAAAATFVGAVNASLEYVGLASIGRFVIPGARQAMRLLINESVKKVLMSSAGKKAFLELGKRYAMMVGTEAFTEMAQEGMNILGGEISKYASSIVEGLDFSGFDFWSSVERVLEAGKAGAGASAVLGLGGVGSRVAAYGFTNSTRDKADAVEFRQQMAEVAELVEASETKNLSPEHMERFLDQQGMGEELYIEGEVLNQIAQDEGGKELIEKLGVDPQTIEQRSKAGQAIGVKASTALSKLSYEEQMKLGDHFKASPGAMSKAEADAFNVDADTAEAEATTAELIKQENEYRSELKRYRSEVAEIEGTEYAEHLVSVIDAFATRIGMEGVDKVAFAKKLGIKNLQHIRKVKERFNEPEFHDSGERDVSHLNFKRWTGGAQVIEDAKNHDFDAGKPVVVKAFHGTYDDIDAVDIGRGDIGFHVGNAEQAEKRLGFKAADRGPDGQRVVPVYARLSNPIRLQDTQWDDAFSVAEQLASFVEDSDIANVAERIIDEIETITRDLLEQGMLNDIAAWKATSENKAYMQELRDLLLEKGYDSIIYANEGEYIPTDDGDASPSFIVLQPQQIKSVFNKGPWSEGERILYQAGEGRDNYPSTWPKSKVRALRAARTKLANGTIPAGSPAHKRALKTHGSAIRGATIRHKPGTRFAIGKRVLYGSTDGAMKKTVSKVTADGLTITYDEYYDEYGNQVIPGIIFSEDATERAAQIDRLIRDNKAATEWYDDWNAFMQEWRKQGVPESTLTKYIKIQAILSAQAGPQGNQRQFTDVVNSLEATGDFKPGTMADGGLGIAKADYEKIMEIWRGQDDYQTVEQKQKRYGMKIGAYMQAGLLPKDFDAVVIDRHMPRPWGYNITWNATMFDAKPGHSFDVKPWLREQITKEIQEAAKRNDVSPAGVQAAIWYAVRLPDVEATSYRAAARLGPEYLPDALRGLTVAPSQNIIHYGKAVYDVIRGSKLNEQHNLHSENDIGRRKAEATEDWPYIEYGQFYAPGTQPESGPKTRGIPHVAKLPEGVVYDGVADPLGLRKQAYRYIEEAKKKGEYPHFGNVFPALVRRAKYQGFSFKLGDDAAYSLFGETPVLPDGAPVSATLRLSDVTEYTETLPQDLPSLHGIMKERVPTLWQEIERAVKESYPEITVRSATPSLARFESATSGVMEYGLALRLDGPLPSIRSAISEVVGLGKMQRVIYLETDSAQSGQEAVGSVLRAKFKDGLTLQDIQEGLEKHGVDEYNVVQDGGEFFFDQFFFGEELDEIKNRLEPFIDEYLHRGWMKTYKSASETLGYDSYANPGVEGNAQLELAAADYEKHIKEHFGRENGEGRVIEAKAKGEAHLQNGQQRGRPEGDGLVEEPRSGRSAPPGYDSQDIFGAEKEVEGKDKLEDDLYNTALLGFYSATEKAIESMDFNTIPAKDLIARIKKTPGIKQEELDHLGLIEWLEGEDGKVSKEQVLKFVRQGGVQLEEVEKSEKSGKTWHVTDVNGDSQVFSTREDAQDFYDAELSWVEEEAFGLFGSVDGDYIGIKDYNGDIVWSVSYDEELGGWYDEEGIQRLNPERMAEKVLDELRQEYFDRLTEPDSEYAAGEEETRYESYTLPGGTNYREFVMRIPGLGYKDIHWDEEDVLLHYRTQDFVDSEGRKILLMEEVQSGLHQAGRKGGYGTEIDITGWVASLSQDESYWDVRDAEGNRVARMNPVVFNTSEEAIEAAARHNQVHGRVPDAPFKKSWPLLAFKRVLRLAAEEGYDAVAWTPGEVQADRYDLSNQIDSLTYRKDQFGDYEVSANKNGGTVLSKVGQKPEDLEGIVGKELAQKIVDGEGAEKGSHGVRELSGLDLKVGGEGMKGFYDKMLPKEVQKYVKKLDKQAKVGTSDIGHTEQNYFEGAQWRITFGNGEFETFRRTEEQAKQLVEETIAFGKYTDATYEKLNLEKGQEVWSLPLTDKLREKVLEGQALFQDKEEVVLGAVSKSNDSHIVSVFQDKRMDTIIHETGHIFLKELSALIQSGSASRRMTKDFDTILQWLGADSVDSITAEQHEQFANGIRDYIGEGRAPTQELRPAFARFKQWLIELFGRALQLDVRTTPEVRAVFDRLFSTRQEVLAAARANEITPWGEKLLDTLGVTKEDREYIKRLYEDALVQAEDDLIHDRNFRIKGKKKKWEEEAEREINEDPVQAALQGAKRLKLNSQQIGNPQVRKTLIDKGVAVERGEDIETAAALYGFNTGAELIEALARANTREEQKQVLIEQKRSAYEAEFDVRDYIAGTKAYDQILQIRARYLDRAGGKTTETSPVKAVKINAEREFTKLELSTALRFDWFLGAIKRHTQAEKDAIRKGDYATASRHNERVRINHEMARLATNLRKRRDVMLRRAKAIAKKDKSKILPDFRNALYDLINRFEMRGRGKFLDIDPDFSLVEVLKGSLGDGSVETRQPFMASNTLLGRMMPLSKLKVEQFYELQDLIKYLEHHGRPYEEQLMRDGRKVDDVQRELAEENESLPKRKVPSQIGTLKRSLSDGWDSFWARSDSLNFSVVALGGFQSVGKDGVFSRHEQEITQALSAAHDVKAVKVREYTGQMLPHYTRILDTMLRLKKERGRYMQGDDLPPVPAILAKDGTKNWTPQMIFALALHYGNESNKSRIFNGFPDLIDKHVKQLFDFLSEEDWDAIQGIWDINDQIFEEVNQVHYRANGYYVKKIPAAPFYVVTQKKDGSGVIKKRVKGGYAPVRYDAGLMHRVADAGANRLNSFYEQEDLLARHESKFMTPSVSSNFTKARVAKTPYPLVLNLDMVGSHIMDALHYVAYEEVIRDVNNVFKGGDFSAAVNETLGPAVLSQMREQLAYIANPKKQSIDPQLEGWLGRLRAGTTAWMLAYNSSVAAKQGLSSFAAVQYIGKAGYLAAYAKYGMNIPMVKKNILFVLNNSEYMRSRMQAMDQEFRRLFRQLKFDGVLSPSDLKDIRTLVGLIALPTGKSVKVGRRVYSWEDVADLGFFPIKAVDMATVMPLWNEAYRQKMKATGGEHETAVKFADETIRMTQPSAQGIDMTKWQRDGGVASMLSMFGTFTIGKYQQRMRLNWRMMRSGKMSKGQYAQTALIEQIIPAIGAQLIVQFLRGEGLEGLDDDDEKATLLIRIIGQILSMPVPAVGNILFPLGSFLFDLPVLTPIQAFQRSTIGAGENIYEGQWAEAAAEFAMAAGHAWSIANRVPVTRVIQKVEKLNDED